MVSQYQLINLPDVYQVGLYNNLFFCLCVSVLFLYIGAELQMRDGNPVNKKWNIAPYWQELLWEGKVNGFTSREEFDQNASLLTSTRM